MKYLNNLIIKLNDDGGEMNPCTIEELSNVKKLVKDKQLPTSYIEFLSSMGRGTTHGFLNGAQCFMNKLLMLNDWGKEILEESNSQENLTHNDFVFWMMQGITFCFFKLDEGEDPPIYYYDEDRDEEGFFKIADTFSEFMYNMYIYDEDVFKKKL